jgi:hypothetical protein
LKSFSRRARDSTSCQIYFNLQHGASRAIVQVFFPFLLTRNKSTKTGFFFEFLFLSKSAHQSIPYYSSSILSMDLTMASFTPESIATTPTMDHTGEDNSITKERRHASANGKRRITPFDRFMGGGRHAGDDLTVLEDFIHYNDELASRPYCLHRVRQEGNKKQKKCYCLRILGESPAFLEAVAEYQVYFGGMKHEKKQRVLVEWIRRTSRFHYKGPAKRGQGASLAFLIPFLLLSSGGDEEDWSAAASNEFDKLRTSTICRDALMDILGLGKATWTTCLTHHATNNTASPCIQAKGKEEQHEAAVG